MLFRSPILADLSISKITGMVTLTRGHTHTRLRQYQSHIHTHTDSTSHTSVPIHVHKQAPRGCLVPAVDEDRTVQRIHNEQLQRTFWTNRHEHRRPQCAVHYLCGRNVAMAPHNNTYHFAIFSSPRAKKCHQKIISMSPRAKKCHQKIICMPPRAKKCHQKIICMPPRAI